MFSVSIYAHGYVALGVTVNSRVELEPWLLTPNRFVLYLYEIITSITTLPRLYAVCFIVKSPYIPY